MSMRKFFVYAAIAALLVSSCGTHQGTGAHVGAQFGSILGSAIGGISNGHRGSNIGTIVGMVGGAVVGGAIGAAADKKEKQEVRDRYHEVMERKAQEQRRQLDYDAYDSGFDATMSGLSYMPAIEIRNARIVDQDQNRAISRGEVCKVIFEIYNHGHKPLYDLQPTVVEATGNKHIHISPNMHVERVDPGQGIRYTAMLKADNRLKNGMVRICVSVLQGNRAISEICEFNVPTQK